MIVHELRDQTEFDTESKDAVNVLAISQILDQDWAGWSEQDVYASSAISVVKMHSLLLTLLLISIQMMAMWM